MEGKMIVNNLKCGMLLDRGFCLHGLLVYFGKAFPIQDREERRDSLASLTLKTVNCLQRKG